MVLSWELATLGVVATGCLAGAAIGARALTPAAGALAAGFGAVIVVLAGLAYHALHVHFVVASTVATRYAFAEKQRRRVQEGVAGERGVPNVLAHIVLPTALVLFGVAAPAALPSPALAFLYSCAIAFGAADTFASEFGVLRGRARGILSGRPVAAGTNGGVSLLGELWAFVGAATTAGIGLGLFLLLGVAVGPPALLVAGVIGAGFVGCQVDILLGESLENRGWLTKGSTNFLSMLSSILIGVLLLAAAGWPT